MNAYLITILIIAFSFFFLLLSVVYHRRNQKLIKINQHLQEELTQLLTAFNQLTLGVAIMLPDGTPLKMNKKLCRMLGYKYHDDMSHLHKIPIILDEEGNNKKFIDTLLNKKTKKYQTILRCDGASGQNVWMSANISLITDASESLKYFILQTQKLAGRTKSENLLLKNETHDHVSGLLNLHGLESVMKRSISASANDMAKIIFIYLGINDLERLSALLGHEDTLIFLQVIAQRLRNSIHSTDFVAQLTNEHYVLCYVNIGQYDTANFIKRILDNLSRPLVIKGYEIIITTYFGISLYPHDGDNFHTLLNNAETAFQEAQNTGIENTYVFFNRAH